MEVYINHKYETLKVSLQSGILTIQIDRPEANNSINGTLMEEFMKVLAISERDNTIKVLIIEGNKECFCTGMDFNTVQVEVPEATLRANANAYYTFLKSITLCSKIVVAKVDGKVNAGGIGIVAACDIVMASERATFGLSEALFGLLPACVMPFLIRRIGIQKAQWMTLMTQGISAKRAFEIGLVDEVSASVEEALMRVLHRLVRIETETTLLVKDYITKLWTINEETQHLAVETFTDVMQSKSVQNNISNFVNNGKLPWNHS